MRIVTTRKPAIKPECSSPAPMEGQNMATARAPALDMNKLDTLIAQFVTDFCASVHAGMAVTRHHDSLRRVQR
jgi:hypothetical protein